MHAGYPLELWEVETEDGYVLCMERIPRRGACDVAFFMHGILDTSLTWVSQGVTGSMAFAAHDRGFDVWLGSLRLNPPHKASGARRAMCGPEARAPGVARPPAPRSDEGECLWRPRP